MIDFFYGFCIDDTDLQEITKTEVGITKTEVADFLLLQKNKSLTIHLNRPITVPGLTVFGQNAPSCDPKTGLREGMHQKHFFFIKHARHFIFGVKDTWVKKKRKMQTFANLHI